MRRFGSLFVVLLLVALAAGPAFAAPLTVSAGPQIAAPASHGSSGLRLVLNLVASLAVFGITIKSDVGTLANKWAQRAAAASPDYKAGVSNAGQNWQAQTAAAADNYAQGTNAAIADGRFAKGVNAAGSTKFVTRATTLGAQRYAPGVQAATGDWSKGVQGSLDTLKSLTLPPRAPKGDPRNQARAAAVAVALRAHKLGK